MLKQDDKEENKINNYSDDEEEENEEEEDDESIKYNTINIKNKNIKITDDEEDGEFDINNSLIGLKAKEKSENYKKFNNIKKKDDESDIYIKKKTMNKNIK